MLGKFMCWLRRSHTMAAHNHQCVRCGYIRTAVRETEKMEEIS